MTNELKKIPYLGAGLGLRKDIAHSIAANQDEIDVLEATTEHYLNMPLDENILLKKFNGVLPIIPHGLNLSIGTAEELDRTYLKKIKSFCEFIKAPYYSDHFALTEVNGVSIGHLSPIWYTEEALENIVAKVNKVQNFLGLPLILENITSYFAIPEADFEEPEFISEVCRRTGCGILLDLANIHINTYNRKLDPYKWLERFPISSIVQIHIAGGIIDHHNWYHDTHSQEITGVNAGIWDLLEWVVKRSEVKSAIIERDDNFKDNFDEMIMDDMRRIKKILSSNSSHAKSSRAI